MSALDRGFAGSTAGSSDVRTVVLTFDNLGAAAELEAGTWPDGTDERDHPSLRALRGLLDALDDLALPATFFVEASNCAVHPAAVVAIAERGHEIGHHAWRHERWQRLDAAQEGEIIARGMAAFAALGLQVRGFRPPGGALGDQTTRLLREAGLDWCSPEGTTIERLTHDVVSVPFRWPLVDALYRFEPFTELRIRAGLAKAVVPADEAADRLWARLETEPGAPAATLVLHPFLMVGDGEPDAHLGLLRRLAVARDAGRLRVAGGATLVDEVRRREHSAPGRQHVVE